MDLYNCPDCNRNIKCDTCFRFLTAQPLLIRNQQKDSKTPIQLFQQGNILYYRYDKNFSTKKNEQFILPNFPETFYWKMWGLDNTQVKIVFRTADSHTELFYYGQLNIYDDIVVIIPEDKKAPFRSIINNIITWTEETDFLFIYISCEEICFLSHKIMHDESLFVDIYRNKLGVVNPIPPLPQESGIYTLKATNGKLKWLLDED